MTRREVGIIATPHAGPAGLGTRAAGHRVQIDGKQFRRGDERFYFRGVTYGTFRPRADGARFPERERVARDFAAMRDAGFTVVRTYTVPPEDVVELAAAAGLYLLADVFYPDWRYLVAPSVRELERVARQARAEVRRVARRFARTDHVLALTLGNEVPADVLRWVGTRPVADTIDSLVDVVKQEDPDRLVTYGNYPTAEYLPLDRLDFLTFNVFLEGEEAFRSYLARLHTLAGDRPLVLGEIGLNAGVEPGGELRQADVLSWQLATALERGVAGTCLFTWTDEWWVGDDEVRGWHFGLTRADRSPRPALGVARRWNHRTVRDLDIAWPSMSVVICAYNAASTLEECLAAAGRLDYPTLEIIVVDDGSTDRTAEIARRFERVRLVTIPHGGLAVARNEGLRAARGKLVAYLDSDAYPTPEWPYYLALGMDRRDVGGVGGPNLPPQDDPALAQLVARAPGGPIHVLIGDDRAEHVPGCNMAFWKEVLDEVGGFDPVYTAAGDDVDVCWRVQERGWEIAFHPAALVWHHRRGSIRAYLRQQWGYGRSEALVEARHPTRFTAFGTARWRGRIYGALAPALTRQRIYRGLYGAAAYQSIYRGGGYAIDIAHQVGVPLAALLLLLAVPLAILWPALAFLALASVAGLGLLLWIDAARTCPVPGWRFGRLAFRLGVATLNILQPLARTGGRLLNAPAASRQLPPAAPLPFPIRPAADGVLLMPADRPRADLAAQIVTHLRRAGLRVVPATGWEDYDARILGSVLVAGDLITSAYPQGAVQLKIRPRLRRRPALALLLLLAALTLTAPVAALVLLAATSLVAFRGFWRVTHLAPLALQRDQGRAAPGGAVEFPKPDDGEPAASQS